MPTAIATGLGNPASDRSFFGHPRGLSTLFFTEMWERFSYYGMRGFLILYMTAPVSVGGMGLGDAVAGPIYGSYTSMVYFMSLPGGWLADRLFGQRRAVVYGGVLIAAGHYSLAIPWPSTFYFGLVLIVLGTGLLKPNISVIVGQLYAQNDIRRDAGFSIFYMGINLGATIGPLITGFLAQDPRFQHWLAGFGLSPDSAWHFAFGAAGVGMTFGVIQYILGSRSLGTAGLEPTTTPAQRHQARTIALIGAGAIIALVAVVAMGVLPVTPAQVAAGIGYMLVLITIPFFGWLLFRKDWTPVERARLWLVVVLFLAVALFWSIFEQAGSTLNLFADRSTNNVLPIYGAFPSSWFQSLNSTFIIVFAPVFAWLWIKMGTRQPSVPTKFALGLVGAGLGFVILVPAANIAATGAKVTVLWLTATYLIHTWGELCISPIGLSAMTKLAPPRIVSLIMGVWFLGASVGNYLGGQMASLYGSMPLSKLFGVVGAFGIACGVLMFLFTKPLTRLMGGVIYAVRMALEDYRRKRDLTKSREPKGDPEKTLRARKGKPLFFCVQKHLASHLHYDFRIEHNGVLLSWAVPKGPSLDPKVKRLAMHVEDHPFEYGTFEGVIPEGYGAGLVMLWDQGTWQPESDDVEKALAKGDLKFTLDGYKLKGSWVLVRTRGYGGERGSGKSWLLIKHRDEWSGDVDIAAFAPLSVKSGQDFAEILAADNPDIWRTNRPVEGGETGAMLREIIEKAAALKHARASAPKSSRPSPRKTAAAAPRPGRRRPTARGPRAR